MKAPTCRSIIDEADRMWNATWTLEELLGTTGPSEYVAECVRKMWRDGTATNADALSALADRLEARVFELTPTGTHPARHAEAVG